MTKAEYVGRVKSGLGGSELSLEISDADIEILLTSAIRQAYDFMDTSVFVTLPVTGNRVDVTDYDIWIIKEIYDTRPMSHVSEFELNMRMVIYDGSLLDYMSFNILRSTYQSIISRGYKLLGNTLLLDNYYSAVTIEYKPKTILPEYIQDHYWEEWVVRFTSALVKETIGRIRDKYKVVGSPFELDGERILEEGREEQKRNVRGIKTETNL